MRNSCSFSYLLVLFSIYSSFEAAENIYDAVSHSCPRFQANNASEIANSTIQNIFSSCTNWTAINSINSSQQFSDNYVDNIRCLLLYESFVSFCNLPTTQLKNFNTIHQKNDNLTVNDVCKNLFPLLKAKAELGRIKNVITDEGECKYLCSTYLKGKLSLNEVCERSFYFINFKSGKEPPHIDSKSPLKPVSEPLEIKKDIQSIIESVPILLAPNTEAELSEKAIQNNGLLINKAENSSNPLKESIQPKQDIGELNGEKKNIPTDGLVDDGSDGNNDQVPKTYQMQTNAENIDNMDNSKDAETKQEAIDDDPMGKPGDEVDYHQSVLKNPNIDNPNTEIDYENKNQDNSEKPDPKEDSQKIAEDRIVPDRFAPKPEPFEEPYTGSDADMDGNSYFFTYFSFICVAFVIGYVGYHNKQKVFALLLEGRNSRRPQRGRRPNSANYHKLDSNLEEAISSSCSKNTSHVIY